MEDFGPKFHWVKPSLELDLQDAELAQDWHTWEVSLGWNPLEPMLCKICWVPQLDSHSLVPGLRSFELDCETLLHGVELRGWECHSLGVDFEQNRRDLDS